MWIQTLRWQSIQALEGRANMNRTFSRLRLSTAVLFVVFAVTLVRGQDQPAGGKVSTEKRPGTSNTARPPTKPSRSQAERIDGKWWTTGNGFGDSEVILIQNGARISGVIRYADGRTGTVNGTLVGKRLRHSWTNSGGDGGTGWLELSWSNFLGGPWHNQTVRDGSWTMNRIEGRWCWGGSRDRILTVHHDATGQMLITSEQGVELRGHLQGPWLFLDLETGSVKGSMFYKGNRIDWANAEYWTWCGRLPAR
jgi:hypothetical protein